MSEKTNKAVEEVAVPKVLKMRELGVMDMRTIVRYLNKTNLKKAILDAIFQKEVPIEDQSYTWSHLRADLGLNVAGLTEAKEKYATAGEAAAAHGINAEREKLRTKTSEEKNREIVELVLTLLEEDDKFDMTLELLADLYSVSVEEIQALPLSGLMGAVTNVVSSADFLA